MFANTYDYRYNLDGDLYYAGSKVNNRSFNQIYRNGIMEIVTNMSFSIHSHNVDNIRGSEIPLIIQGDFTRN